MVGGEALSDTDFKGKSTLCPHSQADVEKARLKRLSFNHELGQDVQRAARQSGLILPREGVQRWRVGVKIETGGREER